MKVSKGTSDSYVREEALAPIQAIAGLGIGVILSRHERKSGGDVGDSGRGSSAWGGPTAICTIADVDFTETKNYEAVSKDGKDTDSITLIPVP